MGIRWTGNILGASGWVVAPNAFITAGHCVYDADKGGWITEARFVPHLYTGNEREFIVTTVYTLKGWIETSNSGTQEDYQYDMAACVISQGFDLESSPPLSFDIGPAGQYSAIGYPSTPMPGYNFNGVEMWKSIGNRTSSGPYPVDGLWWAENNLTGGASGGPWCEPGNNYVVSGINSFRLYDPNEMASPALEQGFQNLYDAVKNL
ncbi:MAG TPA: hypothetical protein VK619_02470 [Pyrinomonadaceae bacterium]|nr:hypothetical protein [Pyrinomonadaceae bacterium]